MKSILSLALVLALVYALVCEVSLINASSAQASDAVETIIESNESKESNAANTCTADTAATCMIDGNIGSMVIYEDASVRIWNFTLAPGEMTSMHEHRCNYHFVALQPSILEVFVTSGESLFSFEAKGVLGFKIVGDELVQVEPKDPAADFVPIRAPRVHSARNIGHTIYNELLFESKTDCVAASAGSQY
jgi:quercetin dioxygenase-like cupin family protein